MVACVGSTSLWGDFHLPLPWLQDSLAWKQTFWLISWWSTALSGHCLEFRILRLTGPLTFSLCLEVYWYVVGFRATLLSFDCHLSPLAFVCSSFLLGYPFFGIFEYILEFHFIGTSLAVQWLRPRPPNAGGPGSIPGQGTRSHMSQRRSRDPVRHN